MKRLLELLASLAATAAAVAAAAPPGHKVPLTRTNRNCDGTVPTDCTSPNPSPPYCVFTQPFGFVNLVETGADKLVAAVVLKGGTPNAIYNVRLIQNPPPPPPPEIDACHLPSSTLTTDSSGDGSTNVQQAVLPHATSVFVDILINNPPSDTNDYFTTDPILF
jgi:hypothetical protein